MHKCVIKVERYLINCQIYSFALYLTACQNQLSIAVWANCISCSRELFVLLFYVNSCLRWINCLLPLRELRLKQITPSILPSQLYWSMYLYSNLCEYLYFYSSCVRICICHHSENCNSKISPQPHYPSTHSMEFLLSLLHLIL